MPEARGEAPGIRSRRQGRPDILIVLEDPGAANFVLDFPAACEGRGLRAVLAAAGPARTYLSERGVPFLALDGLDSARQALVRLKPRLAMLGTADRPDALNCVLADDCRALGIPSVGIVDGWGNLERRFRGATEAPLAHAPDWILVPDQASLEAYAAFGHPRERLAACGHPALDRARQEAGRLAALDRRALRASLVPEAPPNAPLLVFAAEISRTADPAQYRAGPDYTLHGSGRFTGRTDVVLEELLDALEDPAIAGPKPAPFLVLRLHPKNEPEEFAPFRGRVGALNRGASALELAYAADAVIGMTTILLAEAACLGRPTLALVPRPAEKEWLWSIAAGLTRCAQTRSEVRREVAALLRAIRDGGTPVGGPPVGGPPEARASESSLSRVLDFFEARLAARSGA